MTTTEQQYAEAARVIEKLSTRGYRVEVTHRDALMTVAITPHGDGIGATEFYDGGTLPTCTQQINVNHYPEIAR